MTTPRAATGRGASMAWIWAALLTLYIVWGSTYLAIKVGVETLPPFLMASVRFLISGAVLYAWSVKRGATRVSPPTRVEWRSSILVGAALLLGGNGLVTKAEQTIPSGIAGIIVATMPLWVVVLSWAALRMRPTRMTVVALAIGFAGVVILVIPSGSQTLDPRGAIAILVSPIVWASGSLYSQRARLPGDALLSTGMQMLAGGVCLAVAGVVTGELPQVDLGHVSPASLVAFAYLTTVGSLLAYTAYVWLLQVAPITLVSTYAYVNPVVAVFLGGWLLQEPITGRTLLGGGVILAAVALIVATRGRGARAPAVAAAGEADGRAVPPVGEPST
jgi:drug/metabolite transporter (DMT)-like permease